MAAFDQSFIKRATKVTSFNLTSDDFTSLKNKKEIQYLYAQHMFGDFDPDKSLTTLTKTGYNRLVNVLKNDDKEQYKALHNLALKGVGPAEAALYVLTKRGHLGGGSSAGVDLVVGSKNYEVKAVKWKNKSRKDYVSDFKLGGGITGMTQLEQDIQDLAYRLKLKPKGSAEISGSIFDKMRNMAPTDYAKMEKRYQKLAKTYFKNHEVVFVQNEANQPDYGEIMSMKVVKESDIMMERFTSKSIKPLVRV